MELYYTTNSDKLAKKLFFFFGPDETRRCNKFTPKVDTKLNVTEIHGQSCAVNFESVVNDPVLLPPKVTQPSRELISGPFVARLRN